MARVGRNVTLEAVAGPADVTTSGWVDISAENRTGFDVSILELERPRNDGSGRLAHDRTEHAEGTVSFTLDSTAVSRPLFAFGGGRRMSFRYSPEGSASGRPFRIYQSLISVSKAFEAQGAVTYTVNGTIEIEPLTGSYA